MVEKSWSYRVNKIYNGLATVRSNDVERLKKEGKALRILYKDDFMLVPHEELDNYIQVIKTTYTQKYPPYEKFHLCDYKFVSTQQSETHHKNSNTAKGETTDVGKTVTGQPD